MARGVDGKAYRCKACANLARKGWNDRNPEQVKASNHSKMLKHRYGITPADYGAKIVSQGGGCAMCGTKKNTTGPKGVERFCVDHCHTTGTVRGLLCSNCNRGLGYLKDSPELLRKAALYLESYQGVTNG